MALPAGLPAGFFRLIGGNPNIISECIGKIPVYVCNTDRCELAIFDSLLLSSYRFSDGSEKKYDVLLNGTEINTGFYIRAADLKQLKNIAVSFGGGDGIRLEGVEGGKRRSKQTARKRHSRKRKHTSKYRSRR